MYLGERDQHASMPVWWALLEDGPRALPALVETATERLMAVELRRSGGATDVALWGHYLYPTAVLESGVGRMLLRVSSSTDQVSGAAIRDR